MPEVSVESLSKSYRDIVALRGLSLQVDRAAMYGLVGPDGAGKSTFMRIAACLLLQSGGSVTIGGFDTMKEASRVKGIIGYMPQHFGLYTDLSVGENLAFFADLFGIGGKERHTRIDRLLEFSRLGPFVKRRAGALSGGMKKKLALSCTLIHTPSVLLLDEPTTGVDPVSRHEFWNILGEVKREGTTIIVSTPYMDEAERCDRVGFVLDGAMISEGIPTDFPGRFTREILAVRGLNVVRKTRGLTFPDVVYDAQAFGDRVHLTVGNAASAEPIVRRFLAEQGFTGFIIEQVAPSMEDVFVENMSHGR